MKKQVAIHIGDVYGSITPTVIYTLLGSCVSVCLYDPAKRIGGMNHILLPGRADLKHFDSRARFGINAMELLINKMMNLGADRRRLVAKAFGGAHVLPSIAPNNGTGRKITNFVQEFLKRESIPLISMDLGGRKGRKIYFHTDSGEVFVNRIRSGQHEAIFNREHNALPEIRREIKKPGQITWFT